MIKSRFKNRTRLTDKTNRHTDRPYDKYLTTKQPDLTVGESFPISNYLFDSKCLLLTEKKFKITKKLLQSL